MNHAIAVASSDKTALSGRIGSRSAAVVALLALVVAALCLFAGCASLSPAAESAQRIVFPPAFKGDYELAWEAARERADDAKLLAVQTTTYSQAGAPSNWTFLFVSRQRASAYTVEIAAGTATVTDNPAVSLSQEDFDAIPTSSAIVFDAEEAFQLVVDQLSGDGKFFTARAYLMTYAVGDEDPSADTYVWFFSMNDPQDFQGKLLDASGDIAPAAAYAVDSLTGTVANIS